MHFQDILIDISWSRKFEKEIPEKYMLFFTLLIPAFPVIYVFISLSRCSLKKKFTDANLFVSQMQFYQPHGNFLITKRTLY